MKKPLTFQVAPSGQSIRFPETGERQPGSVSVIVPAFNEALFIKNTLLSIKQATTDYGALLEIIVVDNNSTDATARIARKNGARVVFEAKNQIARARNAGAATARGEYLVFLDADTRVEGNIFCRIANNLSYGKWIGGGAWVSTDAGWFSNLLFFFINLSLWFKNVTVGPLLYCQYRDFAHVGGFDEAFYAAEEFSLARRLKREGKRQQKKWKIIAYGRHHKVVTSSRKFSRFGGLEMAVKNAHLLWNANEKLRQKSQCRFWYDDRK